MPRVIAFLSACLSVFSGCGYNQLRGLDQEVQTSWVEVQNQYHRRENLVPRILDTVQGGAEIEPAVIASVREFGKQATSVEVRLEDLSSPAAMQKFQTAQSRLTIALSQLIGESEHSAKLKSSLRFQDARSELEETESRISIARKSYQEQVEKYNDQVRFFPTNLTAKFLLGFHARETLQSGAL